MVLNASWNIYNFRLPLLKHLEGLGHEIVAIAPEDEYTSKIPYEFHHIQIKSRSVNPFQHLAVLFRFINVFRKVRPDIALLYTIQPNTHGNIAARITGVKTISNVAGLGNLFIDKRMATRVAMLLYRYALKHPVKVFFQNNEDMDLFINHGLVARDKSVRIAGSGVDIERYSPAEPSQKTKKSPFVFLLATRMLWEKGVAEFAQASRQIKQKYPDTIFRLIGPLDADNPTALSEQDMDALTADGVLEYAGMSDSMEEVIAAADCVVLPSYREGLPKILLEAAAMAKPIITTDVPGCSDVVEDGVNGFVCRARDAEDLGLQMQKILDLDVERRVSMGNAGRDKAVREFNQELVFTSYQKAVAACG
ncbi:glycosyltransferase family 4 protein [Pseudomonadota bacterium]